MSQASGEIIVTHTHTQSPQATMEQKLEMSECLPPCPLPLSSVDAQRHEMPIFVDVAQLPPSEVAVGVAQVAVEALDDGPLQAIHGCLVQTRPMHHLSHSEAPVLAVFSPLNGEALQWRLAHRRPALLTSRHVHHTLQPLQQPLSRSSLAHRSLAHHLSIADRLGGGLVDDVVDGGTHAALERRVGDEELVNDGTGSRRVVEKCADLPGDGCGLVRTECEVAGVVVG
mmetsp:Transcript_40566/g.115631  ORF Transcript_40566/g.115631 Transcript_40566/m.115631 type:complete len:227 (-) Transcript_40566:16-696(-)